MSDSIAKSQKIRELFNAEKIDPAEAALSRLRFYVSGQWPPRLHKWIQCPGTTIRIPATPPHDRRPFWPPRSSRNISRPTSRRKQGSAREHSVSCESSVLASNWIRPISTKVATMLADLLGDRSLDDCSAISLIGNSPALGETRFGVVAAVEASVQFSSTYTKPLFGGIVGTMTSTRLLVLLRHKTFSPAGRSRSHTST